MLSEADKLVDVPAMDLSVNLTRGSCMAGMHQDKEVVSDDTKRGDRLNNSLIYS